MALQITTNINVDFYDNKYIMIQAKQYDDKSRLISITCYDEGKLYNLNANNHTAYIKFKKPDGYIVLNSCQINYKGQVLVELTEQMLAASGVCYADLLIVNKGSAIVNIDTGDIVTVDGSSVLTTKAFYIDVQEAVADNSLIESSNEFDGLTDLLEMAESEYSEVIQLAKSYAIGTGNEARENDEQDNSKYYSKLSRSYAIGDADGIRTNEDADNAKYYYNETVVLKDNASTSANSSKSYAVGGTGTRDGEDTDNSKYYCEQSNDYANNASAYADKANGYANDARAYADKANGYANDARTYANNARTYANNANGYANDARTYANNANGYADKASAYADDANDYTANARTYANNAQESEQNAYISETNALNSANLSKSYAVGGTNTRDGEDTDNSKYYYELVKNVINSINKAFVPMGTISFSELATVEKAVGYTYNISDDFVTDDTFKEGANVFYTAGTNVYYTADGYWDCFGGASTPVATVDETKDYLGI